MKNNYEVWFYLNGDVDGVLYKETFDTVSEQDRWFCAHRDDIQIFKVK